MGCLSPSTGNFFLCGSDTYTCLPTNWMGVCTLVFLIPRLLHYWLRNHSCLHYQLYMHKNRYQPHPSSSETEPFIQDWDRTTRLGVSFSQFQKLSTDVKESLNNIALQISAIQDQIDSLAVVVLQNRRGLEEWEVTAEKGGLCLS
jgi:hypothetical protein